MKTILIQIDPHDDLTSIKDKMTWAKSARMLLFFPSGYPLFQTDLALRLIQRYSVTLGSQLAIVTRDRILRTVADDIGIPCFTSAPQAEKSVWKVSDVQELVRIPKSTDEIQEQKNFLSATKPIGISSNFQKIITSALLLLLLVTLALFFIPSALIILFPVSETQKITYEVTAGTEFLSADFSGKLPAIKLNEEITASLTKNSTGTINIPISKASGSVDIINASSQEIFLPTGSRVTSATEPPRLFTLIEEVNLKANSNEAVSIRIEANEPGVDWNMPSDVTFIIEGYEDLIQVQNPVAINGGKDQLLPSPGEADYLNLQKKLTGQLLERCEGAMEIQVKSGQTIIPESIRIGGETEIIESPPVGQPSDSATLSVSIECSALVISEEDEIEIARRILDQNLLNGKIPLNNDISIAHVGEVKDEGHNRFSWIVSAGRKITQMWDIEELSRSLLGKSKVDAGEIISESLPQTRPAIISMIPSWWKFLPLLPTRLHFEVGRE